MPAVPSQPQTALHHLHELRRRLSYCAAVMVVGGAAAYVWRGDIIAILQHPLHRQLFYTSPTGSFEFVMQVCLLVGFLLALPVICYHLLRFIEPAFPRAIGRRLMAALIGGSLALTAAGVIFAYFVSLPAALRFFNTVGTSSLHPLITIDQYFSFVVGYLATFAVVFQLPLVLLFINKIKPLGPGSLGKWRKHVVIGAFAIALVMPSAPDPLSQVILALPIIVLYELSIWLVRLANLRRDRQGRPSLPPVAAVARPAAQPAPRTAPPLRRPMPAPRPQPAPAPVRAQFAPVLDLRASAPWESRRPVPQVNIIDLRPHNS